MTINVFEADTLMNKIQGILKEVKGISAYILAKNLRLLTTELTEFEKAKRDLLEKYGDKEENTVSINSNSEHFNEFVEEMKIYEQENIEVEFRKLTEEQIAESGLNGEQIFYLSKYMVE